MKYFLDTEFIEYPCTIDLISIGIVADDGREYYAVSTEFNGRKASDWVKKNVINLLPDRYVNPLYGSPRLREESRVWKSRGHIASDILMFCSTELYDKPEFWGYYCDYDWVAFCWLFGAMIDLPEGFPMYCRDIKQFADDLGDVRLPEQSTDEHDALNDARWNKEAYYHLSSVAAQMDT